jgi:hypothetical protein
MSLPDAFHLSRIYAQGWNAARRCSGKVRDDPQMAAALNPYPSEPEHTRWSEGFSKALE